MKKISIILILLVIIITGCDIKKLKGKIEDNIDKHPVESIPIMQFGQYKEFSLDNVSLLNIIRYTEAGVDKEKVNDKEKIQSEYNTISRVKVLGETKRACEDNTTIYEFIMKDNSKVSFEFECDWLVVGNKRYEIEKVK